jgi:hypothetical protein
MSELKVNVADLSGEQLKSLQSIREIQELYGISSRVLYGKALMLRCAISNEMRPLDDFVYDGRVFLQNGVPVCKDSLSSSYVSVDELIDAYTRSLRDA